MKTVPSSKGDLSSGWILQILYITWAKLTPLRSFFSCGFPVTMNHFSLQFAGHNFPHLVFRVLFSTEYWDGVLVWVRVPHHIQNTRWKRDTILYRTMEHLRFEKYQWARKWNDPNICFAELHTYSIFTSCQCMFIGFWFSHSCLHDSWTPWVFTFPLFTPWRSLPPPVGWWSVVVHLDHLVDHGNDQEETRDHGHVKVWQPPVFSMVETPKARNSMLKKAWSAQEW